MGKISHECCNCYDIPIHEDKNHAKTNHQCIYQGCTNAVPMSTMMSDFRKPSKKNNPFIYQWVIQIWHAYTYHVCNG